MAIFAETTYDGPRTDSERPRSQPLSAEQVLRRRNALWLFAVEIGLFDPAAARVRRHTPRELAELWGCSKQTVLNGIASAKAWRDLVWGLERA